MRNITVTLPAFRGLVVGIDGLPELHGLLLHGPDVLTLRAEDHGRQVQAVVQRVKLPVLI